MSFNAFPQASLAHTLTSLGWDDAWAAEFTPYAEQGLAPGRVVRVDRGQCDVLTADGIVRADTAFVRSTSSQRSEGQILAANVDHAITAVSLAVELDPGRIERFLALAWESGAKMQRREVYAERNSGRMFKDLTGGVGDDLDVHAVPAVFGGVIGPAVADAVGLGEGAVQQEELRIMLAQGLEQARGQVGQQAGHGGDVRVGGADGYPEAGRDPGEGTWRRRYTRATSARWCGGSLHRRSLSRVTMSIVTHSTRACGRSSATGWGPTRLLCR